MITGGKGLVDGSFFIFRQFMNFFISKMQYSIKSPNAHKTVSFYQIIPTGNRTDKSEK